MLSGLDARFSECRSSWATKMLSSRVLSAVRRAPRVGSIAAARLLGFGRPGGIVYGPPRVGISRALSSTPPPPPPPTSSGEGGAATAADGQSSQLRKLDYDEQDDYEFEEPKTFADKVRVYSKLSLQWMLILGIAGLSAYMVYELVFSGVSPTKLYDEAFARLQHDETVKSQITGEDMRCYGRGGSESRRNQVDSFSYTEENDRPVSKRTRIRFNIEGKKGKALVYAEVSDNLPEGEKFVYLIVQDRRTGRVLTVVDNRDRIDEASRNNASLEPSTIDKLKSSIVGLVGKKWE